MGMKLIKKIRDISKLKNYGIMKALVERGYELTTAGVDAYEKENARSMRIEIICGLREISGLSWEAYGALLDEEFSVRKRKKT